MAAQCAHHAFFAEQPSDHHHHRRRRRRRLLQYHASVDRFIEGGRQSFDRDMLSAVVTHAGLCKSVSDGRGKEKGGQTGREGWSNGLGGRRLNFRRLRHSPDSVSGSAAKEEPRKRWEGTKGQGRTWEKLE